MAYCAQQIHTSMAPLSIKISGQSGGPRRVNFSTGSPFAIPLSTFPKLKRNVDNKGGPIRVVCGKIIAIDLGTTNSVVAATSAGQSLPVIIPGTKTPSVVAYTQNGDCIVGQMAKQQAAINPENTFSNVKYFIGKRSSEVDKESEKQVSYRVVSGEDGNNVRLGCPAVGKHFAVEEISAKVLRKLVNDASRVLKDVVTEAVISVPARFSDAQVKATIDAGCIAGLDNVIIVPEPVAVSYAYAYKGMKPQILLVFDLGGATFDVSVLELSERTTQVLSTSGDMHLGGNDFEKRIVDWLAFNFKRDEGIELLEDKQARQRLTEIAEKVKIELSYVTEVNISLPFITTTASGPKHIKTTLTRAKFEELCADLFDSLKPPVVKCISDAKLSIRDLDGVILVGGSTYIPAVQEHVKKLTGIEPNLTINPDEVVSLGAAIVADEWRFAIKTRSKLDGETPLSIGLETLGGVMTKVIPGRTPFPTSTSGIFTTATDGQTSVKINVLQGEGEFVRDNKSLGCVRLDGIPPTPYGTPQIEVTFDIDANGVLTITAVDKGTGKKQDIIVTDATDASCLPLDEARRRVLEKYEKDMEDKEAIDRNGQGSVTPVDNSISKGGVAKPLRGMLV